MGFTKKQVSKYGEISYFDGKPTTIKFDAKAGQFKPLSSDFGSDTMTVAMIKDVTMTEMVLYPHNEKKRSYEPTILFFIDMETNEVCSGIIKNYSHGTFLSMQNQIKMYNRNNGTDYDYTDLEFTMEWIKNPKKPEYFVINFTFCKDKDGKPCSYFIENKKGDLEVNEAAIISKLDAETYARNEKFFADTNDGEMIFDFRLGQEILNSNFSDKTKKELLRK